MGDVMRHHASLVAALFLSLSVDAAAENADHHVYSHPIQLASLTLEPKLSREKGVVDLTGNWQGYASVGRNRVNYEWQISQEGQKVFGTILLSTIDGLDQSSHAFEGTIQGSVLVFRAIRWLSPQLSRWCMAAGKLKLDETTTPPELKGTWGPNPIPGGCPAGARGRVQLMRR
jgi:hypothetical protein